MVRIGKPSIESGAVLRIEVAGTLTGRSSRLVMDCVEPLLHGGNHPVILNLSGVRQIDLSGLGTLLEVAALAARRCADLLIVGPCPSVNTLVAVRILTLDICFQSSTDAIRSLPGRKRLVPCAREEAQVAA